MTNTTPLVSVCMITYNHENFIREAIEGVLMQKTNFPIELIIGEDYSTDSTRSIISEYAEKFPDIICPMLHDLNVGMMKNFVGTLEMAKGKYISICEGDDYWTDPYKLQKQVDFLEANPEYSICFHPVKIRNEAEKDIVDDYITREVPATTTILDLAEGNYIHTPSVLFRKNNDVIDTLHTMGALPVGDYVLHMLNAKYGKIMKLTDVMGVYRVHSGGVHSLKSGVRKSVEWILLLEQMSHYFTEDVITKFIDIEVQLLNLALSNKNELSTEEQKILKEIAFRDNDFIFNLAANYTNLESQYNSLNRKSNKITKIVKKISVFLFK